MKESVEELSRQAVMDRLEGYAVEAGLEPVQMGGLYDLQAQLGRLITSSLRLGLGGLLLLFLGVAAVVSRSAKVTTMMVACLAGVPLVVLGTFGWLGVSMDIITSPAANVALAMGVDSMIHLVVRVRHLGDGGLGQAESWSQARSQIMGPVLAATLLICVGFGIFGLSTFPPTGRFGLAVILGTMTAAIMALITLPLAVEAFRGGKAEEPQPA
jgi:predicted RND superfamily exporter protein